MTEPTKEQDSIFQKIEWASNTHKDKLMFGLDELGASIAREHRLHGVLMESKFFILGLGQELQKTREQLEIAEKVIGQIDKIIESDDFEGYSDEYREKRNVIDRYFKGKQGE